MPVSDVSDSVSVAGVDVAERRGLDLVVLDRDRQVVTRASRLGVPELVARIADLRPTAVCIDSPSGWALAGRSRQAERDLRRHFGIPAFPCPSDPGDHPFYRWMRVGIATFDALAPQYPLFRGGAVASTAAEVYPAATSVLLAGRRRTPHESKRDFRQLVLRANGVVLPGATIDQVDAALAALTGILAFEGASTAVGAPAEGVILLPLSAVSAPRAPG